MLIRTISRTAIAAAVLATAVMSSTTKAADTVSITIGQGGYYNLPAYPRVGEVAPYALTGNERGVRTTSVNVYHNYGQSQLVIPDVVGR